MNYSSGAARLFVSIAPEERRVCHLRRLAAATLAYWGIPEFADSVQLLVSEMAANAIIHGKGEEVSLLLVHEHGRVRIEIGGQVSARPVLIEASPDAETGRGVFIMDVLADAWGVSDDGTTTWCTVAASSLPDAGQPRRP